MRRDLRTRSAMVMAPAPSELGSRSSKATTLGCRSENSPSPSSRALSTVMRRSDGGISLASARRKVVLPALVAPAIIMFLRARTAAEQKAARRGLSVSSPMSSSRPTLSSLARRSDRAGRAHTSIMADRREPSGSRRSSWGLAESKGRETRPE